MPSRRDGTVVWLFGLVALLATGSAHAQRLVPAPEPPVPFQLDRASIGPVEENGALLVFGRDRETAVQRSIRIDGSSNTAGPGVPSDRVADVISCGGSRWIVEYGTATGRPGTSIGVVGAPVVWRRDMANDALVRCVQGRVIVVYRSGGDLFSQVLTPTVGPEQTVRLAPPGVEVTLPWTAAAIDELYVVVHGTLNLSTELVRIVAGTVTHRRSLGPSSRIALAVGTGGVFVATGSEDGASGTIHGFGRADLAPGPSSRVTGAAAHGIYVDGLWPGPQGLVAIAVGEGWTAMMANHHTASLRLWDPATGRLGPPSDIGPADHHAVAWLGTSLVLVQGAFSVTAPGPYPVGETPRVLRVERARVRRYTVGP